MVILHLCGACQQKVTGHRTGHGSGHGSGHGTGHDLSTGPDQFRLSLLFLSLVFAATVSRTHKAWLVGKTLLSRIGSP